MSSSRALVTLVAMSVGACSSSKGATPVASAPDGGTDGGAAACSEPVASRPPSSACVRTVSGRLVEDDPGAAPIALLTTVCGAGLCVLGHGDASGFEVALNRFVDLDDSFVVHVDGRPSHANVFVRLQRSPSEAVVLASPIRIPKLEAVGPALPDGPQQLATRITVADVTLTFAANAVVELDFADAALEAEGRRLRVGRVSNDAVADPSILALYALAPFGANVTPPAPVEIRLPATSGLADGTAVELVALDDTLDGPDIGKLRTVASATVTGGVAKSDPGTGLSRLTWVGVRAKP